MHPRTAVLACGVCLVVGALVGAALGRGERGTDAPASGSSPDKTAARSGPTPSSRSRDAEPSNEHPSAAKRPRPSTSDDLRTRRDPGDHDRFDSSNPSNPSPSTSSEDSEPSPEDPEVELERLRRELAELREEHREVMGEPAEPPADLEPRFAGPSMSSAVTSALSQANVPGMVEGTDCSEHPCIVLGRLEGDEEAMEEVERAAALSVYDGDVLTLLFWATSVEEPGVKPAETGLFALAFYSFEDRASRGEELDRRIRARVMEFWNHDRPGRPAQ